VQGIYMVGGISSPLYPLHFAQASMASEGLVRPTNGKKIAVNLLLGATANDMIIPVRMCEGVEKSWVQQLPLKSDAREKLSPPPT